MARDLFDRLTGHDGAPRCRYDMANGRAEFVAAPPDLVVEIDRSTDSSGMLAPYFGMGVREAWTWSRRSGTAIWIASRDAPDGFRRVTASVVLPGVTQAALQRLLGARSGADRRYRLRRLATTVASEMVAPSDSGATAMEGGT